MEIFWINRDEDAFKVRVERDEDLWYLAQVIEQGDYIEGETERKIDVGDPSKSKTVRKTFFLGVDVESVEYDPAVKRFRASGRIQKCPEDVSKGRYHSFNVQGGDVITVYKESLSTHDVKRLEDATSPPSNVVLVLVDRDSARFARLTPGGFEEITVLEGSVEKKAFDQVSTEDFHGRVAEHVSSLLEKDYSQAVVASPGFWAENVLESVSEAVKGDVVMASVSRTDTQGFNELLKRPEVETALESERSSREASIVEEVMGAIRDGKACYGWEEVKEKVQIGAVEKIVVSESFLRSRKKEGSYHEVDALLHRVEEMDGDVIIVSGDEPVEKIDGLSGITGVLRWKS